MTYRNILFLPTIFTFLPALSQERPNIVIIIADDLGYGDVSAYGQTTIHTPNIDRLAHEGLSFTDGHATSATSTPSRYGLLTGMYPWRKNAQILPGDAPLIIDTLQWTLPKMLHQAGYTTAAIGKWHLGMGIGHIDWNKPITPSANSTGFDYTCLMAATVDRVPTVYVENGQVLGLDPQDPIYVDYRHNFDGEPTALNHPEMLRLQWSHGHQGTIVNGISRIGYMKGGHSARWNDSTMAPYFLDRMRQWLDTIPRTRPFFLYYALHEPHVPRVPSKPFDGKSGMGARGDVVLEADWCVGELMKALDERGLTDNTLVIFTSDNGPVLNDGYKDQAVELAGDHDPSGGYRGGKYSLFDAGTRVPFFVYWRGHIRSGVCSSLVSQLDLAASLAQLTGQPLPYGLDSKPYPDTFLGKSRKGRKALIVEAYGHLALRYGHYAMIPPYKGKKVSVEGIETGLDNHYTLYDLQSDPHQQHDLSQEKPHLLKKLKKIFAKLTGGKMEEAIKAGLKK